MQPAPFLGPKNLRLVTHCPLCRALFPTNKTNVLEEKENLRLIFAQCSACGGAMMALVSLNQGEANAVGLVIDLTKEEILKYRTYEAVTSDDVLAVHHALFEPYSLHN